MTWTNRDTGESETHSIGNVFVMIGAEPNTDRLSKPEGQAGITDVADQR